MVSLYLGSSVVFLAVFGWMGSRRDPEWSSLSALFSLLSGFALFVACGSSLPLIGDLLPRVPGLSLLRFPVKVLLVLGLPVALMAGRGFDNLLELRTPAARRFGLAALSSAIVFLAIAIWVYLVGDVRVLNVIFPEHGEMAAEGLSGPLVHVSLCLGALAMAGFLTGSCRRIVRGVAVVAVVAVDLFAASVATCPWPPRRFSRKPPRWLGRFAMSF